MGHEFGIRVSEREKKKTQVSLPGLGLLHFSCLKFRLKLKTKMTGILSDLTGKPTAKILEDIDRDFFMSADEAKAYGLIDQVVAGGRENEKK